ncbi:MAG TPA: prepilin-type N-terminal cleavage/methylation domain-containing protein [Planctomycetota bacterium]|nr:prepilin-type N-terminal cleavage/methylation domain-containing protein [Planctomycetota bacterium]
MRHARGFTLLELLVSITMMALIAGSLYGSMYVGFRAQRSATTKIEPVRTATLALEMLRQDFDAALPPTGILAGAFIATDGGGLTGFDSVVFYSCSHVAQPGESASDIRKVELGVMQAEGDSRHILVRRITGNLLPSSEPLIREQVLCRNVTAFDIHYYDGTQWLENWDSAAHGDLLPVAAQVVLEFSIANDGYTEEKRYRLTRVFQIPCGRSEIDSLEGMEDLFQ